MEYLIVSNTRKHVDMAVPRKRGDRESHMQYRIGVMEGDDIGLEIVPRTVTIMEAAIAREPGLDVAFQRFPVGWTSYLEHGHPATDDARWAG